jgi:hypothetical protein
MAKEARRRSKLGLVMHARSCDGTTMSAAQLSPPHGMEA